MRSERSASSSRGIDRASPRGGRSALQKWSASSSARPVSRNRPVETLGTYRMKKPKTSSGSQRGGRPKVSAAPARRRGRSKGSAAPTGRRGRARPRVRREPRDRPSSEGPRGRMDSAPSRRSLSTAPGARAAPTPFGGAPRPLHILLVGWEFPPNHTGGLGVHCFELCQELTRLGHRVTFLSPFGGPFTPVPGVTFRHPGEKSGGATPEFPPAYWAGGTPDSPFADSVDGYNAWITGLTTTDAFDVIHVHDWFGTVGASALARRLHLPFIMTVHSTEYDRSLGHPWDHILHREELGIEAATRVIAVSRHLRQ